jgi:molybdenum cofactor cytidylyltransferase
MQFGRVKLAEARGCILAHNLKTPAKLLRKGALIDAKIYKMLEAAGYSEITVARLEPGDIPEGEAAIMLGQALLGVATKRSDDIHGRVNLFATAPGLLRLNTAKIQALNLIDEAITLATLPDYAVVAAGTMIGTLKIIPFAVGFKTMERALALIAGGEPAFTVKPFAALNTALILTTLPQLKAAAIATTIEVTKCRIEARTGFLLRQPITVPHVVAPLTDAIGQFQDADLILISGASAVTDRLDVAPAAMVAAGGAKIHFGMPVDPGNLICFGEIAGKPVIVLPGCARSPKLNGIDWVLDRIFAGEPVTPATVAGMGVGGLLKEIDSRPAPREKTRAPGFGTAPKSRPRIAAIILAAGFSRRAGPENKLLAPLAGTTMIAQVTDTILASIANPVVVVTGHEEQKIKASLTGRDVSFVFAPDHADGMAASLRAGIAALSGSIGAALICLGDMPLLDTATLNRIITAYDPAEGREIIIPVVNGQRGNPVLWGAKFFPELLDLAGDVGARQILHKHMESIYEIETDSDAILRDFDTAEALATLN